MMFVHKHAPRSQFPSSRGKLQTAAAQHRGATRGVHTEAAHASPPALNLTILSNPVKIVVPGMEHTRQVARKGPRMDKMQTQLTRTPGNQIGLRRSNEAIVEFLQRCNHANQEPTEVRCAGCACVHDLCNIMRHAVYIMPAWVFGSSVKGLLVLS